MPEKRNSLKKKKVQKVDKDIEVLLEMNNDAIIHRLLNYESEIDLFILNEFNITNSESVNNKQKVKTKK